MFRRRAPDPDALAARGDVAGLIDALRTADAARRARAAAALQRLPGAAVDEALRGALLGGQALAASILARRGGATATPALVEALASSVSSVQQAARATLVELRAADALRGVVQDSPVGAARAMALRGIVQLKPEDLPEVLSICLEDPDPAVRTVARDAGARPRRLDHADPARRADAIRASRDPGALPALLDALRDPEPEVRAAAALALGRLRGPAEPLVEAASDPHRDVRAAAVRALGQSGQGGSALLRALGDPDPGVADVAAVAVGSQRLPEALDALVRLLERGSSGAAWALGRLGDPRGRPALERALGRSAVAGTAAEALGDLGDPAAIPALEAFLRTTRARPVQPGDLSAQDLAEQALERLRSAR